MQPHPASELPCELYRAEQVRALDAATMAARGISAFQLMSEAAEAAFAEMRLRWPQAESLLVACGGGNNGGDGYVMAGLAKDAGLSVRVGYLVEPSQLTGAAASAWEFAEAAGVVAEPWSNQLLADADLVVDALLGTGLHGLVRDAYAAAISAINQSGLPVLAVDIPSGLHSDTGMPLGECIRADHTVTFIGVKQGLVTGLAGDFTGTIRFAALGAPNADASGIAPVAMRTDWTHEVKYLPSRPLSSHKGQFGRVLVVGGGQGLGGAAILAANAALRSGAGLVAAATHPDHISAMLARVPEVMARGVTSGQALEPLLHASQTVVLGPGLGQSAWATQMLQAVLASEHPLVLDADALNLITEQADVLAARAAQLLLTPHPGEAARLLGTSVAEVMADRFAAADALAQRYQAAVLLKGYGTVIAAPGQAPWVATVGNPGMATGGTGDVLSGIAGAWLAQGLEGLAALRFAAALHGAAADWAATAIGYTSLVAGDVLAAIAPVLSEAERAMTDAGRR